MKTYQKALITIGIVIAVLIAAIIFIFSWEGSPKQIVSVADQFQPPTSWQITSEIIHGPKIVCIEDHACPELSRRWLTDESVTSDDLQQIIDTAGWSADFDNTCRALDESAADHKTETLCMIDVSTGEYWGSIYVTKPKTGENAEFEIYLSLQPE